MKRIIISVSIILQLLLVFGLSAQTKSKGKGLILAGEEKLKGIPIASTPYSGDEFPNKVDLSDNMPTPGNQGDQNSCVAWVIAYAVKSYQEWVEERKPFDQSRLFSPSYIYNQMNNGRDGGSSYIFSLNLVSEQGCVTLDEMPYNSADYLTIPSDELKSKAKKYKIDFWRQVDFKNLMQVKSQLNAGYPVMVGVNCDEGFEKQGYETPAGAPFIWREHDGSALYGHAMLVVGFSDELQAFKILNSWGPDWANGGYGWISYDFFPKCVSEAFVAKDGVNKKEENISELTPMEILFIDGKNALEKDEYDIAISKLTEYISQNPNSDTAHNLLGLAYFKSGNNTNAVSEYKKCLAINPSNINAYNNLGLVLYKSGDYSGSIECYDKVIKADPNYAESYFYRGLANKKTAKYKEAVEDLTVAIDFRPDNHNIYYHRGIANFELNEFDKAERDFSDAIKYNPKISVFYLKRGLANYKLKNFDKAIEDYTKAVEVNPENFDANKELGLSYYKNYKYDKSIVYLTKALQLSDGDVTCYYVRGLCYYSIKDYDNAVIDWERLISIDPGAEKQVQEKLRTSRNLRKK
jgi:tetratricopeptide (TPR) repeat protein